MTLNDGSILSTGEGYLKAFYTYQSFVYNAYMINYDISFRAKNLYFRI